ncbi:apolipoprotein L6 isoform X1 [Acinonyx jubatus]|uniref:Apolipoprotein L6 isoform X1 n=3 Tax=Acinonyx jubatus TaxID=32536 RepID=A0A6J2AE60_ACIJB|nr:apolipoprotein L6 isoform X1 [Acinonyx jubatus]
MCLQSAKRTCSVRSLDSGRPALLSIEKSRDTAWTFTTMEAPHICQEGCLTGEDTSHSPMGRTSTALVAQELVDDQAGKGFEAGIGLQRDQDDILPCEGVQQGEEGLSPEEITFLEEFPIVKEELEAGIRKLHALADHINTTHRTLTKTNMAANSMAVVSGAMSILALVLAPATAGGSLMFSAAGKGLGTAAGVTSILINILGHFRNQEARAQVSSLVPTRGHEVGEPGGQKASYLMAVGKMAYDYGSAIKDIKKDIRALQIARAHPRLATAAKRLLTTGRVSARRSRQVQRAFKGTTLLMTTNIRLLGSAMAGLSLGQDLTALLKDWKRLKEGARTKSAEELRAQTWELERTLTELTQLYESLKRRKLFQEERPRSSSSGGATGSLPQPPARRGEAGPQGTQEDEGRLSRRRASEQN